MHRAPLPAATLTPMTPAPDAAVVAEMLIADLHVASNELGFDKGVAPAPGRVVDYLGQQYIVVAVAAIGNDPIFSGGSRFVITTKGGALEVGLRATADRERRMATASPE